MRLVVELELIVRAAEVAPACGDIQATNNRHHAARWLRTANRCRGERDRRKAGRRIGRDEICAARSVPNIVHHQRIARALGERGDVQHDIALRGIENRARDRDDAAVVGDLIIVPGGRGGRGNFLRKSNLNLREAERLHERQSWRSVIANDREDGVAAGRRVGRVADQVLSGDFENRAAICKRDGRNAVARISRARNRYVIAIPLESRIRIGSDANGERHRSSLDDRRSLRLVRDRDRCLNKGVRRDHDARQAGRFDEDVIHVEVRRPARARRGDAGETRARRTRRRVIIGHLPRRWFRLASVRQPDFSEDIVCSALRSRVRLVPQTQPVPSIVLPGEGELRAPRQRIIQELQVPLAGVRLVAEHQVDALARDRGDGGAEARAWSIAAAEVQHANPREHFLHGIVVAAQFVEQMVRITGGRGDVQHPAANGKGTGPACHPVWIERAGIEIILKAADRRADIGRQKLGLEVGGKKTNCSPLQCREQKRQVRVWHGLR